MKRDCWGLIMSTYFYFIKMKILTTLAYRFDVFTMMITHLLVMFATIFLWKTAYRGIDNVAGVNEIQMVTYAVISILLSAIYIHNVENVISNRIREGAIAIDMIRPINLLLCYFSEDIGELITAFVNRLAPLLLIVLLFFPLSLPKDFFGGLLFIISCGLGYGILWLLSALVGMIAFWSIELGNMGVVKDALVRLLSGGIIPLWLFPKNLQVILSFLPFQYIYQIPLSIYIGKLSLFRIIQSLIIQGVWLFVLLIILCLLWQKAKRYVLIQGG